MIISVEELKKNVDCGNTTDDLIESRLKSIEAVIRTYTHNNFQQRNVRFVAKAIHGCYLVGNVFGISDGDTIQISDSSNEGLYTVRCVGRDFIEVKELLLDVEKNLITRIKYPADVVQCAIDLFAWKQKNGEKVGIKSETLSRHSVTYEDSGTLFMGYPTGILNGLNLHKKARC